MSLIAYFIIGQLNVLFIKLHTSTSDMYKRCKANKMFFEKFNNNRLFKKHLKNIKNRHVNHKL